MLVPFQELMDAAARGQYAVGYFESWNLESLLAVADAAEAMRSPVLLGFSGIFLPSPARKTREYLADYAALALAVGKRLPVPTCLLFNESPNLDWVLDAINLGFGLVMFTDDALRFDEQVAKVSEVVRHAHPANSAVEGEVTALAGVGGELTNVPEDLHLTDVEPARRFVEMTGVDALAVNVGQAHLHGRRQVQLNLERLAELREAVSIPLVLHGATSVAPDDLRAAIQLGIRKVNIGSSLKRVYFETLRETPARVGEPYNPYDVIGSGTASDVLTVARLALQETVERWIKLLGSAGHS